MVTRRGVLLGAAGVTAATAALAVSLPVQPDKPKRSSRPNDPQGIEAEVHGFATLLALNLLPGTDAPAMLRWMKLLKAEIEALTAEQPSSSDPQPELVGGGGGLAIAVGFGPSLFKKLSLEDELPEGFGPVPALPIDQLKPEYTGGDVLLQIQSDLPIQLSHAVRVLLRDSTAFSSVHWQQNGFTQNFEVGNCTKVQRNLMGQVDGTDNPKVGSEDFQNLVRMAFGPSWCRGGTQLVIRRIRMKLDTWDSLGRAQQEATIGRRQDNGAPLGSHRLNDPIDLNATDARGLKVIPEFAHVRRASATQLHERFYRRPYNYEVAASEGYQGESGMLWLAYAANLERQYLPVQRRLADFDLLNTWTVPVGSATFVIPRTEMLTQLFRTRT